MEFQNKFKDAWQSIESSETLPRRLRKLIVMPFDEMKDKVLEQDSKFVTSLVESLYAGDVYILKKVFPQDFMINLRNEVFKDGKKTPSEFYKMLEGCPNFHRIIDATVAKNYSFESYKHSYYFFPWNKDRFNLFEETNKRWSIIKILSGLKPDEYVKNTPKDGVVDRIQIVHYPSGTGKIETHSDPYLLQRVIISGFMTKRGRDYSTGGAYFVDKGDKKINIEDNVEIGDFAIYFPTVYHGVTTVDESKKVDWNSKEGRWWFGPFSNATDYQKERHTGYSIKDNVS